MGKGPSQCVVVPGQGFLVGTLNVFRQEPRDPGHKGGSPEFPAQSSLGRSPVGVRDPESEETNGTESSRGGCGGRRHPDHLGER